MDGNYVPASDAASPEFCIPTSIESVLFLDFGILNASATPYPHRYPSRLCSITTAKTVIPQVFS